MNERLFLDTNILVYAYDKSHPQKSQIAQSLILEGIENDSLVLSTQVLSEFFVTVTQKTQTRMTAKAAKKEIELFRVAEIAELDFETIRSAIDIHIKSRISYWDSLIIVTAQMAQCTYLMTEDLNDGQAFGTLHVKNPFLA